jgi:hypothetical protein
MPKLELEYHEIDTVLDCLALAHQVDTDNGCLKDAKRAADVMRRIYDQCETLKGCVDGHRS